MNRSHLSWLALVLLLVTFVSVNLLASRAFRHARVDLTEAGLYTLSQGTLDLLAELEEPVHLDFYFSRDLAREDPRLVTYGRRVQEMLEEFRDRSNGKVILQVINPVAFSEHEDRAVLARLKGVLVPGRGETFYFGLVGRNTVDQYDTIDVFNQSREQFLEYDITKLIQKLNTPYRGKVGVLSSMNLFGDDPTFNALKSEREIIPQWAIIEQLRGLYSVVNLDRRLVEVPADVDILLLVHPRDLNDATLYAVDQFVLRGGKAIVYLDPWCLSDTGEFDPTDPYSRLWRERRSSIPGLLEAWGVEFDPKKFVGDMDRARTFRFAQPDGRLEAQKYLAELALGNANMNADEVSFSELQNIHVGVAGAFGRSLSAPDSIEFTPLIRSSSNAQLMDVEQIEIQPRPRELLDQFKSADREFTLAARLTGSFPSAYPDGAPEITDEEQHAAHGHVERSAHLAESQAPGVVVLFGDTDLLYDRYWIDEGQGGRIVSENHVMTLNLVESLFGGERLLSIRSRGKFTRPFEVVEELRRDADRRFRARESQLQEDLRSTQVRIQELRARASTATDETTIAQVLEEMNSAQKTFQDSRRELRQVQYNLRREIEELGFHLKLLNIALLPLLTALAAAAVGLVRLYRRRA